MSDTAAQPQGRSPGHVTIVRDAVRLLTKQVRKKPDRTLETISGARLVEGDYRTVVARNPSELAAVIQSLTPNEALIHGVAKNGRASGPLATKDAISSGSAPVGAVAKTKDAFEFAHGPGWAMLDVDLKDAPPHLVPATLDEARSELVVVAPALESAPMLAMPSASANIFVAGTDDRLRGLSGIRIYVLVSDAVTIPELGRRLHERLVLGGRGFVKITATGVFSVSSVLDTTVWSPERLDYAAAVVCGQGLEQRRAPRLWNDEAAPVSLDAVPELTAPERQRLHAIEAGIRAQARPEADRRRAAWLEQRRMEGRKVSVRWSEARAVEYLGPEHEIKLATGKSTTVATILREPTRFHNTKCYDPLEPDYDGGRVVGAIYTRTEQGESRAPLIHSKAHGGTDYILQPDVADEFSIGAQASLPLLSDSWRSVKEGVVQFNERFALVRSLGMILHTPRSDRWELMDVTAWRQYTKPYFVFDGEKRLSLANSWLAAANRRVVSRLAFEPNQAPLSEIADPLGDIEPAFNTFAGFAMSPSASGSCDLFLKHLREVIANGDKEIYRWVLMWLADIVQSPAVLPETALVLRGPQGAGKDTVGDVMRRILGPSLHATIADPDQLTGRFNALQEGKLMLQVQEGFFAGNRGDRGKLKYMISSPVMTVERKGVDAYEIRNCARQLITSNEDWVVPAELGNRRYMVLEVSGRYANDLPYHRALRTEMFEHGGCARLLYHLLHEVDVDKDAIRRPLATAALRDQQIASLDPERQWLLNLLVDGVLPGDERGEGTALKDDLFQWYEQALRGQRRVTKTALTQFLSRYGVLAVRQTSGARAYAYQFPPLADIRQRFGSDFTPPIEWDATALDWYRQELPLHAVLPMRKAS